MDGFLFSFAHYYGMIIVAQAFFRLDGIDIFMETEKSGNNHDDQDTQVNDDALPKINGQPGPGIKQVFIVFDDFICLFRFFLANEDNLLYH